MDGVQLNINVASANSTSVMDGILSGLKGITEHLNTLNKNFVSGSQQSVNAIREIGKPLKQTEESVGNCTTRLIAFSQAAQGIANLRQNIDELIAPGVKLNGNMKDLQAITGITGDKLKEIEMAARASAKAFGNDAAQSVESYKLILSQLDPSIAKNSAALKAMGDNVSILSKTMGNNAVAATEVLTTAMNQYGVSTKDPMLASKQMAEMMNIMAAAAKEGSAELPQIKAAIEQSGMMAKTANVSFAELNAGIQVLDKAGKKGAEGGNAMRNIIADLSQGEFMHRKAKDMLEGAGISVEKLGDKNITLSQRLALLKPIVNDNAKMVALFGKENVAAGIALVQGTQAMDDYKGKIVGTNTAVDQAGIVMSGYQERMNRMKAAIDDVKISIFNHTQAYLPYLQGTMKCADGVGKLASTVNAISTLYDNKAGEAVRKFVKEHWEQVKALNITDVYTKALSITKAIATGVTWLYTKAVSAWRNATVQATVATEGLSVAIINIPLIGWIAAAIMAIVAAVIYLWETSKKFRETLFGIWEAAKAVFANIGIVVMRLWDNVLKPVFNGIWTICKAVFYGIWIVVKTVFEGIVAYFKFLWGVSVTIWTGIYNTVSAVIGWIWGLVKTVGGMIADFFGGIWTWIAGVFKGVGSFIDEWLIQPIKKAFEGLWSIITAIFGKIMEKMKALFAPIVALWNKIFSKDGLTDVGAAYEEGKKKGGESYEKDKAEKKKKETDGGGAASATAGLSAMNTLGISFAGGSMGGKAASGANEKRGKESSTTAGSSHPTTINLTIQKIIGIGEVKTSNIVGTMRQAGEQVVNTILESLQSVDGKVSVQ